MSVKLVASWATVDGVLGVLVDDLERTRLGDIQIFKARFLDHTLLNDEPGAIRILLAHGNRMSLFYQQGVLEPIDSRVNSEGKDVLMMSGQDLIVDNGAVGRALGVEGLVDGLGAEDTGGTDFEVDVGGGAELPGEDVLIVCDRDDGLQDQGAGAGDGGDVGTVVGVLPADSTVLFVQADCVLHLQWFTLGVGNPSVKVLQVKIWNERERGRGIL
jgi:hypothetical protein